MHVLHLLHSINILPYSSATRTAEWKSGGDRECEVKYLWRLAFSFKYGEKCMMMARVLSHQARSVSEATVPPFTSLLCNALITRPEHVAFVVFSVLVEWFHIQDLALAPPLLYHNAKKQAASKQASSRRKKNRWWYSKWSHFHIEWAERRRKKNIRVNAAVGVSKRGCQAAASNEDVTAVVLVVSSQPSDP